MPFALIITGLVLVIAAVRNTQDELFTLVKGDFTGDANFAYWLVVILLVGSVGYIKQLRSLSTAFLVLLVVVVFLTKGDPSKSSGGFFEKFTQALNSTKKA